MENVSFISKTASKPVLKSLEAYREQTLKNILLAVISFIGILLLILGVVYLISPAMFYSLQGKDLAIPCAILIGSAIILRLLDRYISTRIAGIVFTLALTTSIILGDTLQQIFLGRSFIYLIVPVIISGVVIHPSAGYVFAAIISLVGFFTVRMLNIGNSDIPALLFLFFIAFLVQQFLSSLESAWQSLQEREERFRALLEGSSDIVAILSRDGSIQYVSPSVERLLGYSPDAVVRKKIFDFMSPDDSAKLSDALSPTVSREIVGDSLDVRLRCADGSWRILEVRGREFYSHPAIRGAIANCRDITERKQMEIELKKTNLVMISTFSSLNDAVFVLDEDRKFIECNPAATRIFGYTRGEILGRTPSLLHVDENARREFRKQLDLAVKEKGFMDQFEFYLKRKDGTIFPTEHMLTPLKDSHGVQFGWVGVMRDITERKQAEAANERQHRRIKEVSRQLVEVQELEKHLLAAELHDDIGQALTSLKLTLELSASTRSAAARKGKMAEAHELITELMGKVRNLSLELRPAMLDDYGLFAALNWLRNRLQSQTGITIHCNCDLNSKQRFDPNVETAAFRIIQEALTNVARHASVQEAQVTITSGEALSIEIADQGLGFDAARITETSHGSSGLAGMQERARLLGGSVTFQSRPGAGTRVLAELPLTAGAR
jgi:PAS domain S-box-containing protein